ncbi:hypothetical protein, partial [Thermocatellispora tengchongensis]|uniref:hypothetical protein n=1 Tax=Thermocatellispora tengchongensis TaxID=1073253 RepID=UPI0031E4FBCA
MDRDENANDSAEHLFRYLRKHRRDINAWFVLKKDTPDWHRLKKEGFKRLVPHGSLLWKALCLNARHIVSSHADVYVHDPFRLGSGHKPTWKFTGYRSGGSPFAACPTRFARGDPWPLSYLAALGAGPSPPSVQPAPRSRPAPHASRAGTPGRSLTSLRSARVPRRLDLA